MSSSIEDEFTTKCVESKPYRNGSAMISNNKEDQLVTAKHIEMQDWLQELIEKDKRYDSIWFDPVDRQMNRLMHDAYLDIVKMNTKIELKINGKFKEWISGFADV